MDPSFRKLYNTPFETINEGWRDLGNNTMAKSIVNEGNASNTITATVLTNTVLNDLAAAINTHLSTSSKRFHSGGTIQQLGLNYVTIIYEINA